MSEQETRDIEKIQALQAALKVMTEMRDTYAQGFKDQSRLHGEFCGCEKLREALKEIRIIADRAAWLSDFTDIRKMADEALAQPCQQPQRPRIHNIKMLDAIEAVIIEHSGNGELAGYVRDFISAEEEPQPSAGSGEWTLVNHRLMNGSQRFCDLAIGDNVIVQDLNSDEANVLMKQIAALRRHQPANVESEDVWPLSDELVTIARDCDRKIRMLVCESGPATQHGLIYPEIVAAIQAALRRVQERKEV